ncbi:hypothetical protein QYE76_016459 [Lolium multiflorum]|uniref:Histone-lysine N-methyltransferase ASHH2 n=1 Tax=Lolium multiflorum TaxID=4521 RepID=A0AAD8QFU9_LOLMU|nr:hypothetical protein QYE76_016459 [Lolium multiflorum]
MEADARGSADHVATAEAEDAALSMAPVPPVKAEDGAAAMAPAPQMCGELTGYNNPPTEEDEEKPDLAVKLEHASVEAVSAPFQVQVQIGEEEGSRTDEMPMMSVDDEAVSAPFQVKVEIGEDEGSRTDEENLLAVSGDLNTCHVANGGFLTMARNIPCGEAFCSRDVGCVRGAEDREAERSQSESDGLAGNGGGWGGMAEVMTTEAGLKTVSEGLSDSAKHDTERWPRGVEVDGAVFMTDDSHELRQGDSMPKTEPEVSGGLHEDSVPSISGRIDLSLNGNTDRAAETSAPEVSQCSKEADLAGEGVVSCDGALLKTSLDDLQARCRESHCYAVGFSNSVKFDIQQLPHHMEAMLLKKDVKRELETDGLLPKIEANVSSPAHQDSVPTTFGRNLAVHLDGKDGEISQHKTGMEKLASGSLGGGMLSGENKFSTMEGCYASRGLGHEGFSGIELGCPDHLALELNACNSVADKPCSTVFAENGNDEELENQNSESLSASRRRNPRRSASSRNPTLEKHDQICKAINSSRKSNKIESSCSLVESTIIKFPKKITKLRSGINRPLKSTAWGSLQKLTCGFGLKGEPSTSNSHMITLENGRSHKRSGKKEQPSVRNSRSSTCAKNKSPPFSAMGFASDELNGQPTFSVTTGTYASSEGYIGNFPRLDLCALVNGSGDAHKTAQYMSIKTDLQQLDRCLESATQETCPAYICGDFAKSTSEPSLNIASVGFSPDSVLEVASATCENNTSDSGKNLASSSTDLEQWAQTVRGDENTRNEEINPSHAISGFIGKGKVQVLEKSNAVRKSKKVGKQERQKKDGMKGKSIKNRGSTKSPSKLGAFSDDSYSLVPSVPPKSGSCFELATSVTQCISMHEHESVQGRPVIVCALDFMKSPRRKKNDDSGGKKDTMWDPYVNGKGMNQKIAGDILFDSGFSTSPPPLVTDLAASHTNEQNGASVSQRPRAAWVCCDDCQKWRCIPADLADTIGTTNSRWTCKDNQDKTFAGCSIPQEKTNAEINAELDLSDASADEADNDRSNSKASRAPSWTHVRTNSFLHRNRRNQSIDESMVCNCKPHQDGRMGCRDGCLNRMLNIECEKRTCPCGEQCSNQQFQRRSYAKISWFHSGKKGYGLELQEEVSEGRFLIEYVGEVLDITAYEHRQRDYASKGQKHFYFMALNGGEVIDACTKGNLGRFINHSCSPNCRTEKWMVNGEVCIGIFATRNIKKGEELTFDYNYVRVSGAAPQKCFCGTAKCRGYIGGDISGSGIISQDDAEAEHFQPLVTYKDAEELLGNVYSHVTDPNIVEHETSIQREDSKDAQEMLGNAYSHVADPNIVEHETSIQQEDSNNCSPATPDSEPHQQTSPILSDTSEPENSMEAWSPQDTEEVTRTPVHVSRNIESSLELPVYVTQPLKFFEKTPSPIDGLMAPNVMNRSTPSSDMGGSLVPGFHAKKENSLKHHRNVKLPCPIDSEHTLGVEVRLNSLLDRDGGISRRKDSTHEYLRLLLRTAADGEAGGTSKSIRDLALILDALLQTKSGAVLLDIINMNGLQMLHNILKQNRDHFLRRPIIRKLLKVLEFLALRGILTAEKINEGPRLAGMESFRDSMLKLTRHSDKHVHPIARKFCDKWILPYMDGPANCSTHSYSARRKRKSRWDYQPESHYKKTVKVYSGHRELDLQTSLIGNGSQGNRVTNSNHNDVPVMGSLTDGAVDGAPPGFGADDDVPPGFGADADVPPGFGADEDVPPGFGADEDVPPGFGADDGVPPGFGADDDAPPGFEPQQEHQPAQAPLDLGGAPGFCQERYLPNSSTSSEIPVALVQHFGTPEVEGTQCGLKRKVAPGVPFNPRGSPSPSTSSMHMPHHDGAPAMKHNSSGYRGRGADRGGRIHRNWRNGERTRSPYDHEGRRSHSNHHRLERCEPPRHQEHHGSGFTGRE